MSTIHLRKEPRTRADLAVRVWGINATGALFVQDAVARNISVSGALLSGIEQHLRTGDLIGVGYGNRQARYRVVWVRDSGTERKIQVAVHKLKGEECHWQDCLMPVMGRPHSAQNSSAHLMDKAL